jgi:hypothetical protein
MAPETDYYVPDIPDEPRGPGTSDPLGISPLLLVKRAPAKAGDTLGISPLRVLKKEAAQRKPGALSTASKASKKIVLPQGYTLETPATQEKTFTPDALPAPGSPAVSAASAATLDPRFRTTMPTPAAPAGLMKPTGRSPYEGAAPGDSPSPREYFSDVAKGFIEKTTGLPTSKESAKRMGFPTSWEEFKQQWTPHPHMPTAPTAAELGREFDVKRDPLVVGVRKAVTNPKKYLDDLRNAAKNPKWIGEKLSDATNLLLLYDSFRGLGDAYADRVAATYPDQPPPGGPGGPSDTPPAPRPPAPTEGLTPAERRVEQSLLDRVVKHHEAMAEVRRELQRIAPEGRHAALEAIKQDGVAALRKGDMEAAAELAQKHRLYEDAMRQEELGARQHRWLQEARYATPEGRQALLDDIRRQAIEAHQGGDLETTAEAYAHAQWLENYIKLGAAQPAGATTPAAATTEAAAAPSEPSPTGAAAAPAGEAPAAEVEEEPTQYETSYETDPVTGEQTIVKTATKAAAAEPPPASEATTAEEEPPATTAEQTALPFGAEGQTVAAETSTETPPAVGKLADVIARTMSRDQIVSELGGPSAPGIFNEQGAPRDIQGLALTLAMKRLSTGAATPPGASAATAAAGPTQGTLFGAPEATTPTPTPTPTTTQAAPVSKTGTETQPLTAAEEAGAWFTPGNVIYSHYWGKYDKVLSFQREPDGTWKVQVIASDKDGNPIPGERPRWHHTFPDLIRDKVVAHVAAPATAAPTPEAATTAQPEPEAASAAAAKPEAEVEENKEEKTWEATAPSGYVDAQGESTRIAAYGKGREFKTRVQAKRAIDQWKAGLIPVDQYRAQAPAAPTAATGAAPTTSEAAPVAAKPEAPAPAPAASPAAGPVTVERTSGSSWQIPGTDYAIRYVNDNFDIYKGGDHVDTGPLPELKDAKAEIQKRMAAEVPAPVEAAAPVKPPAKKRVSVKAAEKSIAEARARDREENVALTTAEGSKRHNVPVIAVSDDGIVLLDRLMGIPHAGFSNGIAIRGDMADQVIADLRQLAMDDPEGHQGLTALADLMESHRTPNGNVVIHRQIMSDPKINRVVLEELFHDWQFRHVIPAKKVMAMNGGMLMSPSGKVWDTVIKNLLKYYKYNYTAATLEAPAWVASGEYAHLIGVSDADEAAALAVKLLADHFEVAHRVIGSGAIEVLPPIDKALEGKVHDEIKSRGLGQPRKDVPAGDRGRVDPQQPAAPGLPEKLPRGAGSKRRRKAPETELAQSRQRERDLAPVWYLKAERVIADKMKGPMPGPDALRMLQNNGISQDELKWTGLDDYLPTAGRVTPQEIKNFIAQNGIRVEEVHKGELDPITLASVRRQRSTAIDELADAKREIEEKGWTEERWGKVQDATRKMHEARNELSRLEAQAGSVKYSGWQEPGGENYRELLLTLPVRDTPSSWTTKVNQEETDHAGREMRDIVDASGNTRATLPSEEVGAYLRHEAQQERNGQTPFRTPHWNEPNVVTHVRMNDRTTPDGKRLLHLEEIQSDWHQKGRKQGYKSSSGSDPQRAVELAKQYGISVDQLYQEGENQFWNRPITVPEDVAREGLGLRLQRDAAGIKAQQQVPDAPFKKTWQEMALRRMVRYAAEHGYDGISWTGGEDQAERYDLSKHLSSVEYDPDMNHLKAYNPAGALVMSGTVEPEDLPDHIGKEAADKLTKKIDEWRHDTSVDLTPYQDPDEGNQWTLLDGNGDPLYDYGGTLKKFASEKDAQDEIYWMQNDHRESAPKPTLQGLDLKVGGEGMRGFYDKIVPSYLNKFGKKFGARVGQITTGPEGNLTDLATDVQEKRVTLEALEDKNGNRVDEDTARREYDEAMDRYREARNAPSAEFQYLPITDEMYDSVLGEGVPMFQSRQREEEPQPVPLEELKTEMEARNPIRDVELPESQRRPIKTFVSPSTTNLDNLEQAQAELSSPAHKLMHQESNWFLNELGLKVKPRSAIGIWEDGAENSIMHEFPGDTDHDLVTYHSAILARAGWQKFVLNFFPHEEGDNILYRLKLPKEAGTAAEIAGVLAQHGINASTILEERDGHAVMIATTGKDEQDTRFNVQNAVAQMGGKDGSGRRAELVRTRGRSDYVGEDDRDRAEELFKRIIEQQENIHPEWREKRLRLESRPGFNELRRLVRETKEPVSPESEEDINTLQSRQRKPHPLPKLKEEAERLNPRGSTVPMMESVLLPHYKQINDIGSHLEDNTRRTLKQLHPGDTPAEHKAMVDRAVRIARDELKYQLAQENSGVDWYTKDIRGRSGSLISEMKQLHPELSDPAKERMFLLHTAITSPGKAAAFDNINVAEQAYNLYKKTGEMPLTQPDGTPWGSYGNAPIQTSRALLRHFKGDEAKATEWLLTKHPIEELEKVKAKSGFSPNTVKNALPPDYDPESVYGAYILGEKVGPFFMNLNGISTELTVDRWYMRTWNRLMGTLVSEDGEIQDVPRGKNERAAMIAATGQLEKEFGLTTSQVQAALWYYEQGLYSRLGKRGTFGGTYANAAKAVYELRSRGHASIGEANAWRWDDAERGETRGSAGAYPRRARGKNPKGEGEGQGGLFEGGDTSFDPVTLQSLMADAAQRNPRRRRPPP